MHVTYFPASLLAAACLTQRAVWLLTREELGWLMTHIIFTLCRYRQQWVRLSQKSARCLAGGHQCRSNEAISELKCHKSDGRTTNWTHAQCIFHCSTWGLSGCRNCCSPDQGAALHSLLCVGKIVQFDDIVDNKIFVFLLTDVFWSLCPL